MPKQNFLMVSLEESQAKQLAEVISNATSRKIINFLSEHDTATATQLAQSLNIPLPTVHYNLQKLKEAQLLTVEEFHYSKKGREVDHYKLANKYVIITPKPVKGIKTQLRNILPVALLIAGIGAIIQFIQSAGTKAAAEIAQKAMVAEAEFDTEVASVIAQVPLTQVSPWWTSIALWFLIGGFSALIIYLFINYIRRSK